MKFEGIEMVWNRIYVASNIYIQYVRVCGVCGVAVHNLTIRSSGSVNKKNIRKNNRSHCHLLFAMTMDGIMIPLTM